MLSGNIEVVELLIKKGADIWAGNSEGEQPIHVAAAEDHSDIIVMLAKGGRCSVPGFQENILILAKLFCSSILSTAN